MGRPFLCWVLCPVAGSSNAVGLFTVTKAAHGEGHGAHPRSHGLLCGGTGPERVPSSGGGDRMPRGCPVGVGGTRETHVGRWVTASTLPQWQVCASRAPPLCRGDPVAGAAVVGASRLVQLQGCTLASIARLPCKSESTFLSSFEQSRKVEHLTDLCEHLRPRKPRKSWPRIFNMQVKP